MPYTFKFSVLFPLKTKNIFPDYAWRGLTKTRGIVIFREFLLDVTKNHMPNSPTQREKMILDEIQRTGNVSIKDLVELLDVSPMTVHRDVNRLAQVGLVIKSHGEVLLPAKGKTEDEGCAMCRKPVSDRTAFLLILGTGEQKRACCPHCGLMLKMQLEEVWQAMATDFLHGHILSANQAFFVLGSDLTICCAPSVLSFGSEGEAKKFTTGFGGHIANMGEVIRHFREMANFM